MQHIVISLYFATPAEAIDAMGQINNVLGDGAARMLDVNPSPAPEAAPAPTGRGRGRKPAPKPLEEPTPSAPQASANYTLQDVRAKAAPLIERGMIEPLRKKLAELGASPPKLENLAPAQYTAFVEHMEQLSDRGADDGGLGI